MGDMKIATTEDAAWTTFPMLETNCTPIIANRPKLTAKIDENTSNQLSILRISSANMKCIAYPLSFGAKFLGAKSMLVNNKA